MGMVVCFITNMWYIVNIIIYFFEGEIMIITISTIISFIGITMLALSTIAKDKTRLMQFQITSSSLFTIAQFLGGGIQGCIVALIELLRNIFSYKGKLNYKIATGLIGLVLIKMFPMWQCNILQFIAFTEYTLVLCITDKIQIIKLSLAVYLSLQLASTLLYGSALYCWINGIMLALTIVSMIITQKVSNTAEDVV
jgi:ABC-type siderophore export system fused ATPase/permease subunit